MTRRSGTFYVTTAIPYVNGAPHVGHGLEAVQADTLARYHRQIGDDTYFLTGSDDNSITNVRAAEREKISVKQLVDRNTKAFVELDRKLEVSYDQFIRTSVDERHGLGAIRLWKAVEAAGDIYKKDYFGLYCPSCELFYDENELVDGLCPEHLTPPEPVHETNYFFRLSRYQNELEKIIGSDTYRIVPEHRKNEVMSFIGSGLRDFSISRSRERAKGWGVPVPDDDGQVMYVWFDALSNYITALGYASDDVLFRRYWIDNPNRVHVIGKGIIRFHAVYWPAMLLSADVPLPHSLFVHGYYTVEGRKMSKSLGNTIDPMAVADQYGSEALRYYFLAATPATGDADFSMASFEARYNADLANDLGNLVNRTVSMIGRYRGGVVPGVAASIDVEWPGIKPEEVGTAIRNAVAAFDFQASTAAIWNVIGVGNKYVEDQAPWTLAKQERAEGPEGEAAALRLDRVLFTLAEALRLVAMWLQPFLPGTATGIRRQLGLSEEAGRHDWRWDGAEIRVGQPTPLFPKTDRG